jgi:hypothetical protein
MLLLRASLAGLTGFFAISGDSIKRMLFFPKLWATPVSFIRDRTES